jgi:RNA polymerase sigma factor (sigma-70 family)
MIIDMLDNLEKYAALNPLFPRVVEFLKANDLNKMADGKYEIEGQDLFVNITTTKGKTPDEAVLEAHNRMIDIQIPLTATETYGYTHRSLLPQTEFDEEKDIKFISYAVWWIRQAMLEAIKKKKMLMMVEIDPTDSNDNIFERKIADDEDERIGGASDVGFSNEAEEYKKELKANQKEVIGKLLNSLNSREKEIIEHYYGLSNKRELTLNEIGKKYNLSSERVRQVKLTAIRKLRSSMMMYDDMEELLS